MRTIAYFVLEPMGFFWLLVLISFLFYSKRKIWFKRIATAAMIWLFVVSTPFIPNLLLRSLEEQYSPFEEGSKKISNAHVLVLGGGHITDERLPPNDQLSVQALSRLVEGIRLHRVISGSKLILSGYGRPGANNAQAEVLEETAISLGVDPDNIETIPTPWNTMHEALDYYERFGPYNHPLILVTSAIHMPRAMMHFQSIGLSPFPAPTTYLMKKDGSVSGPEILPSSKYLIRMNKAMHEYVGLFWGKVEWRRYLKGKGR